MTIDFVGCSVALIITLRADRVDPYGNRVSPCNRYNGGHLISGGEVSMTTGVKVLIGTVAGLLAVGYSWIFRTRKVHAPGPQDSGAETPQEYLASTNEV